MKARAGPPIIAIDGPVASGKSTVALALSRRLGMSLIDSGSMYRVVALLAVEKGMQLDDERALTKLAKSMNRDFRIELPSDGPPRVYLGGREVTEEIRSPRVGEAVSPVSAVGGVRKELVSLQRDMVTEEGSVVEGRDIGTVVFPDANLKVYLDADFDERVERRYKELLAKGLKVTRRMVERENAMRDRIDSSRDHSPLSKAPDAVRIDTTGKGVMEVAEEVVRIWNRR